MPYQGERASKMSHLDIVKNPEVAAFLEKCTHLTPPSDDEREIMRARFQVPPTFERTNLPDYVIAIDGSYYESSIDDRFPSTKIGYVKIGCILINMTEYGSLRTDDGRYVDPFRVAHLKAGNSALTLTLPSANIRWNGRDSVRDSFRAAVDAYLYGASTRFYPDDPATSLRTTLFHLACRRPGTMGTGSPSTLRLHACPVCGKGPITVEDRPEPQYCEHCQAEVYPSDCLRIWENVSDFQSNIEALSRLMNVLEHLLAVHYIRYLAEKALQVLNSLAVFIDGPLAIFGNPAWLHYSIMSFLYDINDRLKRHGGEPLMIIGLQKSGQIVDHVNLIERFLEKNVIFAIDDDYRYRYIISSRDPSVNGFGAETYYGQDFIYKTPSGRTFVFALPYPFQSKQGAEFVRKKTELGQYPQLSRALALINHFESDLYRNAVVPIALAHRYTAISLKPGGRVLDLLTRQGIQTAT